MRGKRSTQDIAVFVYRDPTGNLVGSGKVSHVIQESELTTELERKRLTNYAVDDVGGITRAFRLAQAVGASSAAWLIER